MWFSRVPFKYHFSDSDVLLLFYFVMWPTKRCDVIRQNQLKQGTQLSLTNCTKRLEVSQGHQTWYHSISYGFLLVCYSKFVGKSHHLWDVRFQTCRNLENRVRGPWRSLKLSPFDTEPMTFYWRSIVTMALSSVISEIFNVEKYRDLEIPVKGQLSSLNVVPFVDRQGFISC